MPAARLRGGDARIARDARRTGWIWLKHQSNAEAVGSNLRNGARLRTTESTTYRSRVPTAATPSPGGRASTRDSSICERLQTIWCSPNSNFRDRQPVRHAERQRRILDPRYDANIGDNRSRFAAREWQIAYSPWSSSPLALLQENSHISLSAPMRRGLVLRLSRLGGSPCSTS
jgi:hypothetical protein